MRPKIVEVSQSRLQELFKYENNSLIRIKTIGNSNIGDIVGRYRNDGYFKVMVDKKEYLLHRLIYIFNYGNESITGLYIDHIDRDKSNNSIENLRAVTKTINNQNRSNVKGYFLRRGKYEVSIKSNGVYKYIGTYKTEEEAIIAYKNEKEKLHHIDKCGNVLNVKG